MRLYIVLDPTDGMTQWVTDTVTFKTRITSSEVAAVGESTFGWDPDGWTSPAILGPEWVPYLAQLPITGGSS